MELLLFIGIAASGKSTFYKERFFHTHLRLNLDQLRTRHRETRLFTIALETGVRMVIDNTNLSAPVRRRYIPAAKQRGYRIIGYLFTTAPAEAVKRNSRRPAEQQVPEKVIWSMYRRLEPPAFEEGFDELYSVAPGADNQFLVEQRHTTHNS